MLVMVRMLGIPTILTLDAYVSGGVLVWNGCFLT